MFSRFLNQRHLSMRFRHRGRRECPWKALPVTFLPKTVKNAIFSSFSQRKVIWILVCRPKPTPKPNLWLSNSHAVRVCVCVNACASIGVSTRYGTRPYWTFSVYGCRMKQSPQMPNRESLWTIAVVIECFQCSSRIASNRRDGFSFSILFVLFVSSPIANFESFHSVFVSVRFDRCPSHCRPNFHFFFPRKSFLFPTAVHCLHAHVLLSSVRDETFVFELLIFRRGFSSFIQTTSTDWRPAFVSLFLVNFPQCNFSAKEI